LDDNPAQTLYCTSVSDVNFCPPSLFLHQTCIAGFVKHLSPYNQCISKWISFAKKRLFIMGQLFNIDKWHYSDVIVIKLAADIQNEICYTTEIFNFLYLDK